ncbi:LAGLIDADG family homing endonuclease [Candidatus Omnitrophota bacterium]
MTKIANLTKEILRRLYIEECKSLDDIGRQFGVSRVAVYKKLKKFRIKQRSKSQARLEAQKQGKLPQDFFEINEDFFTKWSTEMAYVLGLIITDGCVSGTGVISLSMNDKELLEKVRVAMGSQHKITPSKHQKNLYYFHFAREKMVKDLSKFGIRPKKSLSVKFPEIPDAFRVDFIRGVFDGDGSVFFQRDSKNYPLRTKFCSGSKDFIERLEKNLQELGLPERNIYEQKTKNGVFYSIKYGHKESTNLFTILYRNHPKVLYLERKYKKFLEGLKRSNPYEQRAGRVV